MNGKLDSPDFSKTGIKCVAVYAYTVSYNALLSLMADFCVRALFM